MTTAEHLLVEQRGPVTILTFNRAAARNAISPETACRLADAFDAFEAADDARVLVITGDGDDAFCSGGDLRLMLPLLTGARQPEDAWDRRVLDDPAVMDRSALRRAPLDKPLIAAVNGACLAGGLETMLATDIRIAAEHAVFGLPEAKRGVIPFAGSLVRLPQQLPTAIAMELLLTGDPIDAGRAYEMGLVNAVVPRGQALERALAIAERIARNGPVALREIKKAVRKSIGEPMDKGFGAEDEARDTVMATEDAREGPRAFMEKRPARFVGR